MKTRPPARWIVRLLIVVAVICVARNLRAENPEPPIVTDAWQSLRQQGFKTDLADFDFSTSPEMRAREAILKAAVPTNRNAEPFVNHPNLMELVGANSAVVVWKEDVLKRQNPSWPDNNDQMTWDELRQAVNSPQMDAACAAILAGPIAFNLNARDGNYMLLPHLALLKNLTQMLGSRMIFNLHDGDEGAAFTNLLAATRLVTAWNPEPAEISHLVRFDNTKLVFNATWQALQFENWTGEQLARLQAEWESANFLTNLPEMVAFRRASDAKDLERDQLETQRPGARAAGQLPRPPFAEFSRDALTDPFLLWQKMQFQWSRDKYFHGGMYEDEKDLLLFYRDREIEMRNAVKAPTWAQMRGLPGVTNEIVFQLKYPDWRFQERLNQRQINARFATHGSSFLGRAAEAEAERRILVAAIALERFRAKHGSYPQTLAELSPEFLKTVPADFMDGQPLRYHLSSEHFILYSVGLDCTDNGGKPAVTSAQDWQIVLGKKPLPQSDIVWPLPASAAQTTAQHEKELKAQQEQIAQAEEREKTQEKHDEALRQATVKKLLAMKPPFNKTDPIFHGEVLSRFIQNKKSQTNQMTLDEVLSLKQIASGDIATFEVPVSYDVVTNRINMSELRLLVDGGGGDLQECDRATNGDCLLVWNTTYDPPGQHALQAQLFYTDTKNGWHNFEVKGPVAPFYSSNVVQFFEGDSMFTDKGAMLYAKLPEPNGIYTIELKTPDGKHIKTITGVTSNGVINVDWDLRDDRGNKYTGDSIDAIYNVTLPNSGRSQTLKGP